MADRLEMRALLATAVYDGIMNVTPITSRNKTQYWYFAKTIPTKEVKKNG